MLREGLCLLQHDLSHDRDRFPYEIIVEKRNYTIVKAKKSQNFYENKLAALIGSSVMEFFSMSY